MPLIIDQYYAIISNMPGGERPRVLRSKPLSIIGGVALFASVMAGGEAYMAYSASHQAQVAVNTERANPSDNAAGAIRKDRVSAASSTHVAEVFGAVAGSTIFIWSVGAAGVALAREPRQEDFGEPTNFKPEEA
ncbi:MAG: hypothetical protein ACREHG_09570 [Candidatus Saccharimonadales bacterium]